MIYVKIPWDDIPGTAEVTGKATQSPTERFDQRGEENTPATVFTFRRQKVSSVRKELAEKTYDGIVITDIRFS